MSDIVIGQYGEWTPKFLEYMNKIVQEMTDLDHLTELCSIMKKYGSDKGDDRHNYTKVYDVLFSDRKQENLEIFEVGLGTNNEDVLSSMGPLGVPGASLRGWREYFPNARVTGADVDRRILFSDDRIETYFVDQLDSTTISDLWKNVRATGFDLMIDDGLHTFEANAIFAVGAFEKLNPGGLFVIEDIVDHQINLLRFDAFLRGFRRPASLIRLPHATNKVDNVMAIISA